jgi:hypothetical protein
MKKLDVIAAALVIIGALNWGLAGVFHLDLVATVFGMRFGETSALSSVVYALEIDSAPLVHRGGRPRMNAGETQGYGILWKE